VDGFEKKEVVTTQDVLKCAGPTGNIVGAGEKTVCGACGLITGADVFEKTVGLSESFPMSVWYWSGVDHVFSG
jgi:hypothetical protein